MLKAALDTSSSHAAFTVIDESGVPLITLTDVPLGRESGGLSGKIIGALDAQSINIKMIKQWSVGMGPGSFTGIRVGAALVKGICAGTHADYRGVASSLAMVLAAVDDHAETAAALHDGRRSEVLVSPYKRDGDQWLPDGDPFPQKISEFSCDAYDCVAILATDRALGEVQSQHKALCVLDDFPIAKLVEAMPSFTPTSFDDQEASTTPIYVRPAVFVEPTLKKRG